MKLATTRGLTMEISATACALAKTASVAFLSPIGTSNRMLPGFSGHTCGAPGFTALTTPVTAGSGDHFDLDRLDRVARMIDGVGDHEGDGVADMAHLALGEDRIRRAGERIDLEIEQARQVAEIGDVFGRQDQRDAGQALRARRRIDGEFGMRMRRTQHQRVQRRLRRDVVGVAALAADECVVLLAKDALTDAEFDGSSHLVSDYLTVLMPPYCSGSGGRANRL